MEKVLWYSGYHAILQRHSESEIQLCYYIHF